MKRLVFIVLGFCALMSSCNTEKGPRKFAVETTYGTMTFELYDETPLHRDNFIKLTEEGFYDGTLFHRVINNFMIQGGDPDSKGAPAGLRLGMGGPGYTIPAEILPQFIHTKGALAAARRGGPGNPDKESSGSQFYIVHGNEIPAGMIDMMEQNKQRKDPSFSYTAEQKAEYASTPGTPNLDGDYTVFGRMLEGFEVLDAIAKVQKAAGDRPIEDVSMKVKMLN